MKKIVIITCVMLFASPAFAQPQPVPPPGQTEVTVYQQLLSEANDRLVKAAATNQGLVQENERLKMRVRDLEAKQPKPDAPAPSKPDASPPKK